MNLTDMIKSAVLTEPAKSWPTYDDKSLTRWKYVSASEANNCIRNLAFNKRQEKNTVAVDDYWSQFNNDQFKLMLDKMDETTDLGYFARGNTMEQWIVDQLNAVAEEGELFLFVGREQVSFYSKEHKVSGTPDGVYVNFITGEMWLLEFKSTAYPVAAPKAAHITQVQVNMGLIQHLINKGLKPFEGIAHPDKFTGGKLLYVNSSNYLGLQEFTLDYDNGASYVKSADKAKKLFKSGNGKVALTPPQDLPPEGLDNNGCFFCNHKQECLSIEHDSSNKAAMEKLRAVIEMKTGKADPPAMPAFAVDAPKEEVAKFLLEYDMASKTEKEAKAKKSELREDVVAWMADQKDTKLEFTDDGKVFKITLSHGTRIGEIDKEQLNEFLKQMQRDVDDFRKETTDTSTLRVTVKDE